MPFLYSIKSIVHPCCSVELLDNYIIRSSVLLTTFSRYFWRRANSNSKKICKTYYLNYISIFICTLLRDGMSFLFKLLPGYLQWISAFLIPLLNNVQQFSSSRFVNKMVGGEEEALLVFLGLVIISTSSIFIAARFSHDKAITLCFIVAVDFFTLNDSVK